MSNTPTYFVMHTKLRNVYPQILFRRWKIKKIQKNPAILRIEKYKSPISIIMEQKFDKIQQKVKILSNITRKGLFSDYGMGYNRSTNLLYVGMKKEVGR